MAVTDAWLKANNGRPGTETLEKADRDGLSLRLSPKGRITWQMRYRYAGKPRRLDIGVYPLLRLKAARDENHRLRVELDKGIDPRVVRQVERVALSSAESLESLYLRWHSSVSVRKKTDHEAILRSFQIHVFPALGALPGHSVTLQLWMDTLEKIAAKVPAVASRILTNAKQMYKWCIKHEMLQTNPLADISAYADLDVRKNVTSRSLTDEEIRYLFIALEGSRMAEKNKLFVMLNLFYGCRNSELRLAKKAHFDFDAAVWTVPPENHKTGKATKLPLLRPIIPQVRPWLDRALDLSGKSAFMFTNSGSAAPMGQNAQLSLPYNLRQWLRKNAGYEMAHWSIHDLRKTVRTNLSTLTDPHVGEIILGHKLPGQWQVYDHHDYLDEQAVAYMKWWDRLERIVG